MSLTGIVFAIAFAAGCLLALARHPIYGLVTYVSVFYLHPPSRWWGQGALADVRWALIAGLVTLVAVLISKRKEPQTIPLFDHKVMIGLLFLVAWLALQTLWALDPEAQWDLVDYVAKFSIAVFLVYKCVDSETHLKWFLWAHVLGCFALGWIAYVNYTGGRFEGFGGPGIGGANGAALTLATGVFVAASLFLAGRLRDRAILLGCLPIIVNGIVTTGSRSGFLAIAVGGAAYIAFSPARFRRRVLLLSLPAVALFAMLTNANYWERMNTIAYGGQEVAGVDTGGARRALFVAQWQMFLKHPFGCGSTCTAILSPYYLEDKDLSDSDVEGGLRARASHNTFLTFLVDHGFPGALIYLGFVAWLFASLRSISRQAGSWDGFLPVLLPALAASLIAMTVADMFVSYVKFEVRYWCIGLIMVALNLAARERKSAAGTRSGEPVGPVGLRHAPSSRVVVTSELDAGRQ